MKQKNRILLAISLLFTFMACVTMSFGQVGLSDGKRQTDLSGGHLILPNGAVSFVPQPTLTPGTQQGSIQVDGANAYIFLSGVWRKITTASPTPSATFTPTPTP